MSYFRSAPVRGFRYERNQDSTLACFDFDRNSSLLKLGHDRRERRGWIGVVSPTVRQQIVERLGRHREKGTLPSFKRMGSCGAGHIQHKKGKRPAL